MTDRVSPVTEEDLHAYLDGELAADRRAAVEAWLAAHADDGSKVTAWRAQAEAIRAHYGAVAQEPVPARLDLKRLERAGRKGTWIAAAGVALAFLVGGGAGWFGRGAWDGAGAPVKVVTSEALDAHKLYIAEVRHPIEVKAGESHLVPWLSRRVGSAIRAPDLKPLGLNLLGGRLLPGPNSPAALLMYESANGERFTLYCTRSASPQSALRYNPAGAVGAVYWSDGDMGFVVSGPADRERLQKVAESAYQQLEGRTRTGMLSLWRR